MRTIETRDNILKSSVYRTQLNFWRPLRSPRKRWESKTAQCLWINWDEAVVPIAFQWDLSVLNKLLWFLSLMYYLLIPACNPGIMLHTSGIRYLPFLAIPPVKTTLDSRIGLDLSPKILDFWDGVDIKPSLYFLIVKNSSTSGILCFLLCGININNNNSFLSGLLNALRVIQ